MSAEIERQLEQTIKANKPLRIIIAIYGMCFGSWVMYSNTFGTPRVGIQLVGAVVVLALFGFAWKPLRKENALRKQLEQSSASSH